MPIFRKKPVRVTAHQFLPPYFIPAGVMIANERYFVITAHDQRVYLERGDWILPEPDGIHFYPVKPDIFEATYEPVLPGEGFRSAIDEEG